ncbi:MAG: hypothetical protein ACI85Q_002240 [Salibacteraceae bacterium]|jgi:hypothetical protein
MKTALIIITTILLYSISLNANTNNFSHYYISEFNEEITEVDLYNLQKEVGQILTKNPFGKHIYIESVIANGISKVVIKKLKKITPSTPSNNHQKENESKGKSPQLFQLFFNFI